MANIYKRQPIQHKLPTGWSDLDNIRNNTLGTIKGLYHVDNPMTSDQNATYNCKNVYQDESGNLTVRPSLRYIAAPSKGTMKIYNTVKGKIEYIKADNTFYLKFKGITDKVYTDGGKVTIEESDGNVYIFYTDAAGYLGFKVWNDSGVVNADPDILPNNSDSPIPSRYNLLSDKIKAEIMPTMWTEDMWSIIDDIDTTVVDDIVVTKHNDILLIEKNDTLWSVTPYIRVGKFYTKFSTYGLVKSNSRVEPHVMDATDDDFIVLATCIPKFTQTACEITRRDVSLNIYSEAATISEVNFSVDMPQNSHMIKIYPCYNNVTLVISAVLDTSGDKYDVSISLYKSDTLAHTDTIRVTDIDNFVSLVGSSKNNIVVWCYSKQLVGNNYILEYFEYNKDLAVIHDGSYLNETEIGIFKSSADYVFTYRPDNGRVYYDRAYFNIPFATTGTFSVDITENDSIAVGSTLIHHESDDEGHGVLLYDVSNGISEYPFNIDDEVNTIFTTPDGSGVIKLFDNETNISTRIKPPVYREFKREVTDDFPVLSEIKDEILTSFYLDSIYWFVTKHRIFGTGVANEKFSITYFDPRKYFHFTEELTGAVRISDTSFWVFHNNGAYLIYKSTSSVYDETIEDYVEVVTWLVTNTAKSKGCDFDNAIVTLPINNYITCVTADDISIVQMRENVQTDDRILVPITLSLSKFVSSLLNETQDIVTGTYRYNSIFFLNPVNKIGKVPTLVYNVATESWWYWELPVNEVLQATITETNLEILAEYDGNCRVYDLFTEYYNYTIGGLTYQIYADRLTSKIPTQIEWFWESAILHFGTADYRKQLLSTSFTLGERESSEVTFDYNFEVYADKYSERTWTQVDKVIERARSFSYKNIIANFAYLQLYIKNRESEENVFESYTRPKFSTISFKYRILPGGHL